MNLDVILDKVSKELNLQKEIVSKAYKAYWLSVRKTISDLPLKDDLNEQEFSQLRTNFNVPSLGKLSCTYDRYLGMKRKLSIIKKIKDNAKDKEA